MQAQENGRGYFQTAYQIVITNQFGKVVWDTKEVADNSSLAIKYGGEKLQATTKYNWTVTVWDQNNKKYKSSSWFETGLMNPDPNLSAWNGAQWIGGNDENLVFFSHYQLIFKLKYSLAISEGSTKAGFIYGANDIRLMNKFRNIYQIENQINEGYIKLELDISDINNSVNGLAKLNIYRSGYTKSGVTDRPIKNFYIKSSVINGNNKNENHIS